MKTKPTAPAPAASDVSLAQIARSIKVLDQRRKDQAKEHGERIKRLQHAFDAVADRALELELGLAMETVVLAPELLALIDDPTRGL